MLELQFLLQSPPGLEQKDAHRLESPKGSKVLINTGYLGCCKPGGFVSTWCMSTKPCFLLQHPDPATGPLHPKHPRQTVSDPSTSQAQKGSLTFFHQFNQISWLQCLKPQIAMIAGSRIDKLNKPLGSKEPSLATQRFSLNFRQNAGVEFPSVLLQFCS